MLICFISLDESDETDGLMGKLDESLIGKTRSDKLVIYWVSYLDHQQRVILFTQDERIAKGARRVGFIFKNLLMITKDIFCKVILCGCFPFC